MLIPRYFCWTKFSAEAGEDAQSILQRKEAERLANDGLFLWGIGSSIKPSLLALLDRTRNPEVVFTPMLSPAAEHDRQPDSVGVWLEATGLDGAPFEIPAGSTVTSGLRAGGPRRCHYALVCRRDSPLTEHDDRWLDEDRLRNLRTGTRVGSSQVTSVVERTDDQTARQRYSVAFAAQLVTPYQVVLSNCSPRRNTQLRLAGVA